MSVSRAYFKRPSRRKLAAGVAAVLALSASAVSHANTWYVNDCTDGTAAGQFRWAVNGAVAGDTIDLVTQLVPAGYPNCTNSALNGFNHTLTLSSTVTVASGVTIQGPGKTELALWGVSNKRIVSSGGAVTINDLGMKYGSAASGACVFAGGDVTLNNVKAFKCYSYSAGGNSWGGAIDGLGNVSLTGSTIDHGYAQTSSGTARGGAIYANNSITLTNSNIINSRASSSTGNAYGGATYSSNGGTTLDGSIISSATAAVTGAPAAGIGFAKGGAIWAGGAAYLHNDSVVSSASATTQGSVVALGGGIYGKSTVTVGGWNSPSRGRVWFSNAYSKGSTARGGGIYSKGETLTKYAYITQNSVNGAGARAGAVQAQNGFYSKYSYFWANSAKSGGGIIVPSGDVTMRGSSVVSNSASSGFGGVDFFGGGNVTIEQSTIAHNTSGTGSAGGIYISANSTKLYNNTIVYNSGTGKPIEVFGVGTSPTFTIASNLLSSNTYGVSSTQNDLFSTGATISGDHNFIRAPGTGVPGDTIVGKCPLLYPGQFKLENLQYQYVIRHEVASPATNAGSNPKSFGADQRGGSTTATSPPRVSGPPGSTAQADIGSYEIDQSDEIFDERFEGCSI